MLKHFITLARPWQWYKNLVMFIPLAFSGNLFNIQSFELSLLGFAAFCLVSSVGYILNDVSDLETDKRQAEKRKRPLPSGKVSVNRALFFALVLAVVAGYLLWFTPQLFVWLAVALFASNLVYSAWLKKVPLVDVHVIALNFLIRAYAGIVIIGLEVSFWFLFTVFVLALFLAVGKRKVEIQRYSHVKSQRVQLFYTPKILNAMTLVLAAILLMAYGLYTFQTGRFGERLFLTFPIATYLTFRYLRFIEQGDVVASRSELVFRDPQMLSGILLWILVSIWAIY